MEDPVQLATTTMTPSRPSSLGPPANKQVQKANSLVGLINKILGHTHIDGDSSSVGKVTKQLEQQVLEEKEEDAEEGLFLTTVI